MVLLLQKRKKKEEKFKENELYELRFSGGKGYETA